MLIDYHFIAGISLGVEYIGASEEIEENSIIVDIFFVRFLFQWL